MQIPVVKTKSPSATLSVRNEAPSVVPKKKKKNDNDDNGLDRIQVKQKCQTFLPRGTCFMRWLRLWSPWDWWRIAQLRGTKIEWHALVEGFLAVFFPVVFYFSAIACIQYLSLSSSHQQQLSNLMIHKKFLASPKVIVSSFLSLPKKQFVIPYLCSPWTCHFLHHSSRPFARLAKTAMAMKKSHAETLPEAWASLQQSIQGKRVYRRRYYDLFLPPPSPLSSTPQSIQYDSSSFRSKPSTTDSQSNNHHHHNSSTAILFLPGWGVEYTAYANPARMLADLGYRVVLVALEPWRTVSHQLWQCSPQIISRRILKSIENEFSIRNWILVGHSAGALTASHLLPKLRELGHNIPGLAIWGSSFGVNDLSQVRNLKVLVIQGSDDICDRIHSTEESTRLFWKSLPPSYDRNNSLVILGGTHNGFANYKPSNPLYLEYNNNTLEQQQLATLWTHEFFS